MQLPDALSACFSAQMKLHVHSFCPVGVEHDSSSQHAVNGLAGSLHAHRPDAYDRSWLTGAGQVLTLFKTRS